MTNAEFVVLSLIMEQERYGYEIEQVIEERGMREWTEIGFSSIYYLLRKLEKENLIVGRIETTTGHGPARKVYSVTAEGKRACQQATMDAIAKDHRSYPPILIGINNLNQINNADALNAARQHHAIVAARLENVKTRAEHSVLPEDVKLLFEYSEMALQAELDWTNHLIDFLEKRSE